MFCAEHEAELLQQLCDEQGWAIFNVEVFDLRGDITDIDATLRRAELFTSTLDVTLDSPSRPSDRTIAAHNHAGRLWDGVMHSLECIKKLMAMIEIELPVSSRGAIEPLVAMPACDMRNRLDVHSIAAYVWAQVASHRMATQPDHRRDPAMPGNARQRNSSRAERWLDEPVNPEEPSIDTRQPVTAYNWRSQSRPSTPAGTTIEAGQAFTALQQD